MIGQYLLKLDMKKFITHLVKIAAVASLFTLPAIAQQVKRTPFDVTNYVMDVSLMPTERKINATVDVTFTPLEDTRSVSFELNGSLKVDSVTRIGGGMMPTTPVVQTKPAVRPTPKPVSPSAPQVTFIQDQSASTDLGPHVRIDLGENVVKGMPITLRFKYNGILDLPAGGPLLNKRLAYIGDNQGYLMYAARWFPFHDYAADPATSDISITIPAGLTLTGYSTAPVTTTGNKSRFVQSTPALIGNFAYGKYAAKSLRIADFDIQFLAKPGNDANVAKYAETLGSALDFYTKRFGAPASGKRLIVAQIDDDSLDFYSSTGMLFIANRQFEEARDVTVERLQREAAFQWWGLTVGLKSFDDAWLSQGLAEYSAFTFRESRLEGAKLDAMRRELLEKSLTFEQTSSLLRAPKDGSCATNPLAKNVPSPLGHPPTALHWMTTSGRVISTSTGTPLLAFAIPPISQPPSRAFATPSRLYRLPLPNGS